MQTNIEQKSCLYLPCVVSIWYSLKQRETCIGEWNNLKAAEHKIEHNFEKRYRLMREVIETVVLTILMFIIINLAIQNYDVQGPSMEPSLHNTERIMVDKVSYFFNEPARGDVIVFKAPPSPNLNYVKRIIAMPGDVITVKGTTVIVDGIVLNENYVHSEFQGNPFLPIENRVVPTGQYFVMGDDRKNSSDSRDWGFLPRENIIGRAALVYWPLGQDNSGFLPNVSSVFANVHQSGQKAAMTQSAMGEVFLGGGPALALLCSRYRRRKRYGSSRM